MVKLILVRHAESEWNPVGRYQGLLDPDLSERGKKQAKLLAQELSREHLDVIYSSPLKRTYLTALEIAEAKNLEVIKEDRIIEIDHGMWSGMLVEEVMEKYPEDFRRWVEEPHKVEFQGGESLASVYNRVKGFLEEVRKRHWNQTVVVVSHTVPMRAMYCALLGVDLSKFWSFGCDNASYSVIHMEERRNVILKLNITCHLGEFYVEAHKAI
ncbi:Phosphoglycerate mutase [Hydrogenobacter thermophilus TK-6]|uniref:Phosphoserine phosphatase 1 n=1 Tax=Hydrogenobacter thermophilus (strain DSM 6534 / IAM 12695 / TK-6) TaxID=608538 RepID=PSPA_HYDTT|nr:histidine phosphatase family protein [Hydrogenobacter thermophilus]D3DFG8.1 RecName: Full=Phosphoserine phosphatase 1; Short=PSP 1; Short=PSPase 1; AltName: Full=Metal-independent phosphoserine phosphatase 1; Short=iPSP1; AltName: Full=O-phosphoserine phosphohydrolase 1 [Hydrogenobacter thermophilus TK-6]4IJ5_A Chain A, Phosphoserine phosphatase 1 [Hydrogenobacter thermophilus TK-6]4IJ5_B Chain B, Phosphoserine phosphatase 1 [Hydrogenobacter thermophilus TK-6]ADO44514.1 Phosphoglycerate muta